MAGKQLRLIDIKTDQGSTPNKLLAYAASVKANQRELNEARELMDALPVDSPERRNLLRRLFNQHYWLARSVQAAIDESSPAHLAKMLALWEELTDDPKHHDRQSYGMSQDEIATVTLLQCADVAAMRALQYQQDSTAMLAVLEQIISSIEEEIDQLQISAEQRENIPRIINAVHGTRATLLQRRPATTE